MATERSEHGAWANEQVQQLIELGINPIDAQESVDWISANLPYGENPATYIFPSNALIEDVSTRVDDAAAAWMEQVEPRFKRILHAKEETE